MWNQFLSLTRGSIYYISFIDECFRYVKIIPIQKKNDVSEEFHKYLYWAERRTETEMKRSHIDSGGEYVELKKILSRQGIEISRSPHYSPEENGLAKCTNRTVVESALSLSDYAGTPKVILGGSGDMCCRHTDYIFQPWKGRCEIV